ncbi:helix-hairpin-helix domain-containing protein [Aeromicrobium sp. SMF47]|uniref:helix-hairpin-helix domain-containing protein n=1 Tax=Aeromicrobium yanjiei TaxID=2662028 RepID=UPI0013F84CE8|nr:helix-hairpin-helix domain-containing protein [Aeromicrobium yanjiei]MRJ76606.1 helix-hairpin-helix domain-containing protein [Aeromicrobium yanjiei]
MGEQSAEDLGPDFDGIRIGRPAAGALLRAGYLSLRDLPEDLAGLVHLHGVGPKAVSLFRAAREE